MIARRILWTASAILLGARIGFAASLPLIVDVENSRGLKPGDPVLNEGKEIGEVTQVGFGKRDTVEVRLRIDPESRDRIRKSGTFVVNEPVASKRPSIEYFAYDPKSAAAEPNERFQAARSVAEVWLHRGRVSADELSRAMSQGVDQFHRNLEELRRSPEWAKFKDQFAKLSAQLTVTGAELTQLLNEQLPKLQRELDDLYDQYRQEIEKQERERHIPTPAR